MQQAAKKVLGPSHLSKFLAHVSKGPKLELDASVTSLTLSCARRNDHFGARHFLREDLPRIQSANPRLQVHVDKQDKLPTDNWRPEIKLTFANKPAKTIDLTHKWSTAITKEVMDTAGSPAWHSWKAEARLTEQPVVVGEEGEVSSADLAQRQTTKPEGPSLSLEQWRTANKDRLEKEEKQRQASILKAREQAKQFKEAKKQAAALEAQGVKTPLTS